MTKGEIQIRDNTKFRKSLTKLNNELFIANTVFVNSNFIEENVNELLSDTDFNTITFTDEYELNNIDFLNNYDLKSIKAVNILSKHVKDIKGLYSLKHLEKISSTNKKIDYSNFTNLRSLAGEINNFSYKTLTNIDTLEVIAITNKFKEKDVSIFSKNIHLRYLMLRGAKIESLIGLSNFVNLESLNLFHNRNILSLEGITKKLINLREIYIDSCPKLYYVNDFLLNVPHIEYLQLGVKKIDSFKFIDSLKGLKLLSIHNKIVQVEDGNKTSLIKGLNRTGGKIW
ncbi:hypothetical protein [Flavivirga spongiicola]|uniref:Leucine-rich repeat domain-containing protein n=1 Tax=Flavivirga spongiicola TaxID=421621 RepID=A0ABU7XM01_9FLAO|nr:hypothetical protein [Flavivirga sp. MEBiC05379]MDO5981451.1 hypothetical protein [Flavivirga sp. MEBiC05379]MDO5981896.1 hypothetical protein [Flavivirga sp. MEBiC05379]